MYVSHQIYQFLESIVEASCPKYIPDLAVASHSIFLPRTVKNTRMDANNGGIQNLIHPAGDYDDSAPEEPRRSHKRQRSSDHLPYCINIKYSPVYMYQTETDQNYDSISRPQNPFKEGS